MGKLINPITGTVKDPITGREQTAEGIIVPPRVYDQQAAQKRIESLRGTNSFGGSNEQITMRNQPSRVARDNPLQPMPGGGVGRPKEGERRNASTIGADGKQYNSDYTFSNGSWQSVGKPMPKDGERMSRWIGSGRNRKEIVHVFDSNKGWVQQQQDAPPRYRRSASRTLRSLRSM